MFSTMNRTGFPNSENVVEEAERRDPNDDNEIEVRARILIRWWLECGLEWSATAVAGAEQMLA